MTVRRPARHSASRLLSLSMALLAVLMTSACAPSPSPEPPKDDVGLAMESDVDTFLEGTSAASQVRAILVSQAGEPVLERYRECSATDYWTTGSMTMTMVSILVGIAIDIGYLSGVDQTLGELLPAERGAMSEETAATTVEQLLTNTAGLPNEWNGDYVFQGSRNWVRTILRDRP